MWVNANAVAAYGLADYGYRDLALELRSTLGDWFKVVQLVQQGGGDDNMLQMAWNTVRVRANPDPNPTQEAGTGRQLHHR